MGLKLQKRVLGSALPRKVRFFATVLALYGDEEGTNIYPSIDTLARDMGVERDAVIRGRRALVDLGVLVVAKAGGGRRTTRFRMDLAALDALASNRSAGATVSAPTDDGRDPSVPPETVAPRPAYRDETLACDVGETVAFDDGETVARALPDYQKDYQGGPPGTYGLPERQTTLSGGRGTPSASRIGVVDVLGSLSPIVNLDEVLTT